ncbi:MAG: hypothetical protein IJP69_01435 [Synergistaceae bacterium]|nr:hypothetical protein [Synergistaceae bacterium]MBR0232964.1 hypothetical protein [Synergistaceae bacterium]MBR0252444.1 hypothetical protein [Synergistaceae bacterium]
MGVDLYGIKPYSNADLNCSNSRSSVEMRDKSRPEPANKNVKIEGNDTIFIGFPIWWYVAPA